MILNENNSERREFFTKLKSYVYAYCEIDEENRRIPIYIGKGKSDRCLEHLKNVDKKTDTKSKKISELKNKKKLGIDIIAYNLDDKTSFIVEAACIDLMGIENLTNVVKGKGDNIKRTPIEELKNIIIDKPVEILPKHSGVGILINKYFEPNFGNLETYEITRGIWSKNSVGIAGKSKYAYAIYHGVVKEIYEIHDWIKAGTQEYFTRNLDTKKIKNRYEFVGKIAPEELRIKYKGKLIKRKRSYGNPFIKL
jgi:hypothetical protein